MRDDYCSPLVSSGMDRLRDMALRDNIPLGVSFAITGQCNLHCNVCYMPSKSRSAMPLPATFWREIASQSAELGALHVLLTGGECLLHPDFCEIYKDIRSRGMLVTVFTNGTALGRDESGAESVLNLMQDIPPSAVEVSLYGASSPVWERVTGRATGWDDCRRGIERLLEYGIHVRLKMLLTDETAPDLQAFMEYARGMKLKFRFDPGLFNRLDGGAEPLKHRLSAADAVAAEFAYDKLRTEYIEYHNAFSKLPESGGLYDCGAGRTSFHIDYDGRLQPCLMVRDPSIMLVPGITLADAWQRIHIKVAHEQMPAGSPCRGCEAKVLCGYCPGFFEIETGSRYERSEYLCAMGKERLKRIQEGEGT